MNRQQKFLSALVALCKEYDVEINGGFTVWPARAEDNAKPILADIESVYPEGLQVGPRARLNMPRPWSEGMTAAYQAGLEDGREGTARPQRADGFDAAYWEGWTHGGKQ